MKYFLHTYGCQMNYSDSERIATYLQSLNYTPAKAEEEADIIIMNTCSIKQKAEDKVFGKMLDIANFKKKNKNLLVGITGCMVRKSSTTNSEKPDKLIRLMKQIDFCLKIDELPILAELLRELNVDIPKIEQESLKHYFQVNPTYDQTPENQAFIPISMGCDKFCTYCIVPYARGREKSRPFSEIIKEAEQAIEQGHKEIVLLGQTVNSYGLSVHDKEHKDFADIKLPDNKEPFPYLLEELDKLKSKGLSRVLWTSPHPKDMTDQLIEAMAILDTQMPYLHLPVQSGDDEVLKRMNRPYTTDQYREIIRKLREKIPDISISTDIIVGFCDETEEEYENTINFFKEMNFEHAYIAQYSERKGTFAFKHLDDNIPSAIKSKRWHKLNDLLREQSTEALQKFIGKTTEVLVEHKEGETYMGRSANFKTVRFKDSQKDLIGKIIPVKIETSREWDLIGE